MFVLQAVSDQSGGVRGPKSLSNCGAVEDMRNRLIQNQGGGSSKSATKAEFEKQLKEMTDRALRGDDDAASMYPLAVKRGSNTGMELAKSGSGVEVYTKGACSNLKSAFESHIAEKRRSLQRQNSGSGGPPVDSDQQLPPGPKVSKSRSANLPNMFQQNERREKEFQKQKMNARENIPIDKKIFTNFLDKFEDENTRKEIRQ